MGPMPYALCPMPHALRAQRGMAALFRGVGLGSLFLLSGDVCLDILGAISAINPQASTT
jgi:hypothetical protein